MDRAPFGGASLYRLAVKSKRMSQFRDAAQIKEICTTTGRT
jgi:hypothetical protein